MAISWAAVGMSPCVPSWTPMRDASVDINAWNMATATPSPPCHLDALAAFKNVPLLKWWRCSKDPRHGAHSRNHSVRKGERLGVTTLVQKLPKTTAIVATLHFRYGKGLLSKIIPSLSQQVSEVHIFVCSIGSRNDAMAGHTCSRLCFHHPRALLSLICYCFFGTTVHLAAASGSAGFLERPKWLSLSSQLHVGKGKRIDWSLQNRIPPWMSNIEPWLKNPQVELCFHLNFPIGSTYHPFSDLHLQQIQGAGILARGCGGFGPIAETGWNATRGSATAGAESEGIFLSRLSYSVFGSQLFLSFNLPTVLGSKVWDTKNLTVGHPWCDLSTQKTPTIVSSDLWDETLDETNLKFVSKPFQRRLTSVRVTIRGIVGGWQRFEDHRHRWRSGRCGAHRSLRNEQRLGGSWYPKSSLEFETKICPSQLRL